MIAYPRFSLIIDQTHDRISKILIEHQTQTHDRISKILIEHESNSWSPVQNYHWTSNSWLMIAYPRFSLNIKLSHIQDSHWTSNWLMIAYPRFSLNIKLSHIQDSHWTSNNSWSHIQDSHWTHDRISKILIEHRIKLMIAYPRFSLNIQDESKILIIIYYYYYYYYYYYKNYIFIIIIYILFCNL